ncbi:restriction alleviation protein, Lar family [Candidatus Kaiserbacteria bacterium]|nr:restriction alleviation protein, Lar family [Candidatus Kaiserbacteria bacterium]
MLDFELKPCPFCGHAAHVVIDWAGEGIFDAVACSNCDAAVVGQAVPMEQLVEQWNRRVE